MASIGEGTMTIERYSVKLQVIADGAGYGLISLNPIPYGQTLVLDRLSLTIPNSANIGTATIYIGTGPTLFDHDFVWLSDKPWADTIEGWDQKVFGGESIKVAFNSIGANKTAYVRIQGRVNDTRKVAWTRQ